MLHTMAGPSFADQPQEHEPAGNGADYAVLDPNYEVLRRESGPVAQVNAMNPVLNNLLDRTKAGFIRFSTTKLVDNPALSSSFERYLAKLKEQGANTSGTYGFIQLPNGDGGEEEDLCRYGVRSGMNYHGELGDASKGVYLSRYSDVCTPSALLNGQNLRVLVCRVLLGKTKMVAPDWKHKTTLAPDPDFHSHISALPEEESRTCWLSRPSNATNTRWFMYVYEYLEDGTTADRPTMILPLSVVEYQCNKPGSDLLNVVLPRVPTSVVWTGTLSLQKHSVKGVTMHSHFATNIGRPRGMCSSRSTRSSPRRRSPASPTEEMCGSLVLMPEAIISDVKQAMYVQYFVLKCDESEPFDQLCTLMRRFELVGVNRLASGTQMFLVPNGGLSAKLGFFLYNTSVFHCIVASPRSARNANNLLRPDPYER
ncbi:hypothetical protein M3Y99_00782000 [Aphelenchoides fujianensis]|nr:hypothetical protein M3Y99_00782000 [Aphelenchoides fujianensis]